MKFTNTIFLLLLFFGSVSNLYAQTDTAQETCRFLLNKGYESNPVIRCGTLTIEPINLSVQPRPWSRVSPHVQLEMSVSEGEETHTNFITYYEPGTLERESNFPMAWGKHLLSLDIVDDDTIFLVVEELEFGKEFALPNRIKAIVGDLTIGFNGFIYAKSVYASGLMVDDSAYYALHLSNGSCEEFINREIIATDKPAVKIVEWEGYKIETLLENERFLRLRVVKTGK